MNSPLVSILINNYNYGRYLGNAIDSALNQTYPCIEVIVVDDGSTDNSREVIAQYNERITVVIKENAGQASAFNSGFQISNGQIICFLDSDDIFLPTKVSEIVEAFIQHPTSKWVFHDLCPIHSSDLDNSQMTNITLNLSQESSLKEVQEVDCSNNILNTQINFKTLATSGMSYKRIFLTQFFPIPETEGIALNDLYLRLISLYLSRGCLLRQQLGIYRLHSENSYANSNLEKKRKSQAKIYINTAYYLKVNFPKLSTTCNKLFAKGLATLYKTGDIQGTSKTIISQYFSTLSIKEKIQLSVRTLAYSLKLLYMDFV